MNRLDIKKIREELGYTQQELANKLGTNIRTVQKWESGETKIRKSTEYILNALRNEVVNKDDNLIKNTRVLSQEEIDMTTKALREGFNSLSQDDEFMKEFRYRASEWLRNLRDA